LGGSNDITNLWPEAASPTPGFHPKDKVENYLHEQVCKGAMSLGQAQSLITTNWLAVYTSMGNTSNTPVPTSPQIKITTTQAILASPTSSGHPAGTSGKCNDSTFTSAVHKQGACSHHGGVKDWWGS
jgi:hypothetical protein